PAGGKRERDPHQRERADHTRRGGDADTELAGKGGNARRHDPVAERHGERHRGQDRRLARQVSERAASSFGGGGGSSRHAGHSMSGRPRRCPPISSAPTATIDVMPPRYGTI